MKQLTVADRKAWDRYRELGEMATSIDREKKQIRDALFAALGKSDEAALDDGRILTRTLVEVAERVAPAYSFPKLGQRLPVPR
jgi:hypothetical protein